MNKIINFCRQIYHRADLDLFLPFISLIIIYISLPFFFSFIILKEKKDFSIIPKEENDKNFIFNYIGTGLVAFGLFWTAKGLHAQHHHNKRQIASQYVALWYDPKLADSIRILRNIKKELFEENAYIKALKEENRGTKYINSIINKNIKSKKTNYLILELLNDSTKVFPSELSELSLKSKKYSQILNDIQTDIAIKIINEPTKRNHINHVFCFFEQVSVDIKLNVADEDYLKDFFYSIIINYYFLFEKYLLFKHKQRGNRYTFCNFAYLAHRWKDSIFKPELPKINTDEGKELNNYEYKKFCKNYKKMPEKSNNILLSPHLNSRNNNTSR